MAKQKAQAEAKRKRLRTLLAKAEEEMKAGKTESAPEVLSQVLSEADPQSDEAKQARQLDHILAQQYYTIILENDGIPLDVLEANVKRWLGAITSERVR